MSDTDYEILNLLWQLDLEIRVQRASQRRSAEIIESLERHYEQRKIDAFLASLHE